jgi:hypothetical protein
VYDTTLHIAEHKVSGTADWQRTSESFLSRVFEICPTDWHPSAQ